MIGFGDGGGGCGLLLPPAAEEEPQLVDDWATSLPKSLVSLLKRALAKEPAERFQEMDELVAALQTAST